MKTSTAILSSTTTTSVTAINDCLAEARNWAMSFKYTTSNSEKDYKECPLWAKMM